MATSTSKQTPAARVLLWLSGAIFRHRALFGWPHLILAVASIWYTVAKLEFHTKRSALVGADKEYHRIFMEFRDEFQVEDDIVVVVESERMEKNRQFVERLGARLEAARTKLHSAAGQETMETNLFAHVFYKGDLKMMGHKALMFVPEANLREMVRTLKDFRPFMQHFTRATNLVSLINLVNWQISHAREEENDENKSLVKAFPAVKRIVDQATDALVRAGTPPSPGINALFDSCCSA